MYERQPRNAGEANAADLAMCTLVHCAGGKCLDDEVPGHESRAEVARTDVIRAFMIEHCEYTARLRDYLHKKMPDMNEIEMHDWGFLRNSKSPTGVDYLGTPAVGKSSCAFDLSRGLCSSFYVGRWEEELTETFRDRLKTHIQQAKYGRGTQDEILEGLKAFGRSKVHERFRLNIIHSILARNGVVPIACGDLEQVDISWRAYAGYMMKSVDHVLPLHLAPWKPQFYVCLFKPVEQAIMESARQGEDNYNRQFMAKGGGSKHSSIDAFTAGQRSYYRRSDAFGVYDDLDYMYREFLRNNWPRAIGRFDITSTRDNYRLLDQRELNLPVGSVNLIGIIDEVRALVPGVEPGAVISHISFNDVVAAINESPEIRQRVVAEFEWMKEKAEQLRFNETINGHFIQYLLWRAKVLECMLMI